MSLVPLPFHSFGSHSPATSPLGSALLCCTVEVQGLLSCCYKGWGVRGRKHLSCTHTTSRHMRVGTSSLVLQSLGAGSTMALPPEPALLVQPSSTWGRPISRVLQLVRGGPALGSPWTSTWSQWQPKALTWPLVVTWGTDIDRLLLLHGHGHRQDPQKQHSP